MEILLYSIGGKPQSITRKEIVNLSDRFVENERQGVPQFKYDSNNRPLRVPLEASSTKDNVVESASFVKIEEWVRTYCRAS